MKRVAVFALLLAAAPAAAQEEGTPIPERGLSMGDRTASFDVDLSYVRFTRFFDGAGGSRSLDDAFSDPVTSTGARHVAIDAAVLAFDGRIVPEKGISLGLQVPLVRDSRSGDLEIAGLPAPQGFYAEGMAIGDLTADAQVELPGSGRGWGANVDLMAKLPAGHWRKLDPDQLPTGDGEVGIGGQTAAWVRIASSEVGVRAGLMALLPRTVGTDVDRGDPRWLSAWERTRLGPDFALGISGGLLARSADRSGHRPVTTLQDGGEPGSLAPPSSLITVAPFAVWRARPDTGVTFSISSPGSGWLFFPAPGGAALAGKNVMQPETQLTVSMVTVFR